MTHDGEHAIACGDVLAVLRELPDNEFDAALFDPPYGLSFMGKKWDYDVPSVEVFRELLRVLKPGAPIVSFGGTRTYHRVAVNIEDAGFELRDCLSWMYGSGFPKSLNLKGTHAGYGTALKPAWEPAILARKPLEGTVASNVERWGTGALAIDACRIGSGEDKTPAPTARGESSPTFTSTAHLGGDDSVGRWPANVCLDEEAAAALDEQSGIRKTNGGGSRRSMGFFNGGECERTTIPRPGDTGGASRFFYCAKVSTREREHGCDYLPMHSAAAMTDSNADDARLASPRTGAGRGGGARNHHPTLKPVALTKWLARLLLPPTPGAQLLVPYSGAGSEMIGALEAGWPMVFGIEGEQAYIDIAHARIAAWKKGNP